MPDFSAFCRRQRTVTIQIPFRRSGGALNLLVDSRGVKMRGEGEWQVRRPGPERREQWRKVHLAVDTATRDIRTVEFTSSQQGDRPMLPDLLAVDPGLPADRHRHGRWSPTATRQCHTAILERGGTAVLPICRNGRTWKEDCPAAKARNENHRAS